MLRKYFNQNKNDLYLDSLKTLDINNVDTTELFLNLNPKLKKMLIYNAWSQVEKLFREKGNSAITVEFLNSIGYRESWHFSKRTNISFFIDKEDINKIIHPTTREVIYAYRDNHQDEYQS